MEISGERTSPVGRNELWDIILQTEVLEDSIPGMENLERNEDTYSGTVVQKLAGISVGIDADVEIIEDNRPDSMQFSIKGKDNRINSQVDGSAIVTLNQIENSTTELEYEAEMEFSGKLASLGSRLIKRHVNNVIDEFFSNLMEHIDEDDDSVE